MRVRIILNIYEIEMLRMLIRDIENVDDNGNMLTGRQERESEQRWRTQTRVSTRFKKRFSAFTILIILAIT